MRKSLLAFICIAVLVCASVCAFAETRVSIQLTYPAGQSPKVFTTGWVFGARAIANGKDISDDVEWGGTAKYPHPKGDTNYPTFNKPGANTITLSVEFDGKRCSKDFPITAISSEGYAALGDKFSGGVCGLGCPACPHAGITGVIITGSPYVKVGDKPAARKGDQGTHGVCCGPGISEIVEGDPSVLIDGKPAARKGDRVSTDLGHKKIDPTNCRINGTPPSPTQQEKPRFRSG